MPNNDAGSAVRTQKLTRSFGDLVAVDAMDVVVAGERIFGLLGPNGAGKSTAIKMLTTLLPPTSGTAVVAGHDIRREPADVRRHIGYVPQLVSADGTLTGVENLLLSARLYDIPGSECRERIRESLEFMGLTEAARSPVRTYSGGMVRRLELAQAMLHRPAVLFLDEPTIGLDPIARHAVWGRLRASRRQYSMTVVITTHDMEEADELCDELAIMHAGRIVARGTPSALKHGISPNATLDDVFTKYAGASLEEGGNYRDTLRTRRTATRLG